MNCLARLHLLLAILVGSVLVLGVRAEEKTEEKAIQALLVTGGCSHDYENRKEVIVTGIRERVKRKIEWKVRFQGEGEGDAKIPLFESSEWASGYDIVVHDYCFPRVKDEDYIDRILAPHKAGLPAVLIHGTLHSFRIGDDRWFQFCGATSREHDTEHPFDVRIEVPEYPVLKGIENWRTAGGQLYRVAKEEPSIVKLTSSPSPRDGSLHPTTWTHLYGPKDARVFVTSIGNDLETMQQTQWLDMVARGFLWGLGELSEDGFQAVPPEESLKSLSLSRVSPSLPQVGRNLAMSGKAEAISSELPMNPPENAVDGDSATLWKANRPGPASWSIGLGELKDVGFLALIWDEVAPADYSVEYATGETDWSLLFEKNDGRLRQIDVVEVAETRADRFRLTIPATANGAVIGLHEFAAYRSLEDVPAALREAAGFSPSVAADTKPESARKGDLFSHRACGGLPIGETPRELTTTARGNAYVVTETEKGRTNIWHFDVDDSGELSSALFLDNLAPSTSAAWDGEWLYVLEGSHLTAYRDTDRNGAADEKFVFGKVCVGEEESDVSPRFRNMCLGDDGWIYARIDSPERDEGFNCRGYRVRFPRYGIVRFRRDGSGLSVALRSAVAIDGFLPKADGGFFVSVAGNIYSVPPVSVPGWSSLTPVRASQEDGVLLGQGEREGEAWIRHGGEIHCWKATGDSLAAVSLPNAVSASADGAGRVWTLCQGNEGEGGSVCILWSDSSSPPVDLDRVPDKDLMALVSARNVAVRREATLELLRRKKLVAGFFSDKFNYPRENVQEEIALMTALGQVGGREAYQKIKSLTKSEAPEIRARAFLILSDFPESENDVVFGAISEETSPLVTSRILAGILRSGTRLPGLDRLALELAAESDPVLSVSADSYLIECEETDICFAALDDDEGKKLWPTAFRILTQFHAASVVEGIVLRLEKTRSPEFRALGFEALSRLYFLDSKQKEEWSATSLIDAVFRASLLDRRVDRSALLNLMQQRGIALEDPELLVELGSNEIELESFAVDRLKEMHVPSVAADWLSRVWRGEDRDPDLRVRALALLCGIERSGATRQLFGEVARAASLKVSDGSRHNLDSAWMKGRSAEDIAWLISQSRSSDSDRSRLAFRTLFEIRRTVGADSREGEEIAKEWKSIAESDGPRKELWQLVQREFRSSSRRSDTDPSSLAGLSSEELVKKLSPKEGNVELGKILFHSFGCASCHNINGEGPGVGPSLLEPGMKRDTLSLVDAIRFPSKEVNPDYRTQLIALKNGSRWRGLVEWENNKEVVVRDAAANVISLEKGEVADRQNLDKSLMPQGVADTLSKTEWDDLLAFLVSLAD